MRTFPAYAPVRALDGIHVRGSAEILEFRASRVDSRGRLLCATSVPDGVALAASDDFGASFDEPVVVFGARRGSVQDVALATSDSGVVAVAVTRDADDAGHDANLLEVHVSWDGGGSWMPAVPANPGQGPVSEMSLHAAGATVIAPCSRTLLATSCDLGRSWTQRNTSLDASTPDSRPERNGTWLAAAPTGRMHAAWIEDGDGWYRGPHSVALDSAPRMLLTAFEALGACGHPAWHADAVPPDPAARAAPAWQWRLDGAAIPGATGPSLDRDRSLLAPGAHELSYELTCSAPTPRAVLSAARVLIVRDVAATNDDALRGTLRIARGAGTLRLSWSDPRTELVGHGVYEGTIPSLTGSGTYDHRPVPCGIARPHPTIEAGATDLPMPTGDAYYLVSAASCATEGDLGTDGLGRPRPTPAGASGPVR